MIGLTNDGVRIFDVATRRFIDQEISYFIKPEIKEAYDGDATDHQPCGIVNRRDNPVKRTEYILSFRDTTLGNVGNNVRAVLNLSELKLFGGTDMIAPWDYWEVGCEFLLRDKDNSLFYFQNASSDSTIYVESTATLADLEVYPSSGTLISSATVPTHIIKTKQIMPNVKGVIRVNENGNSYILMQNIRSVIARVVLRDQTNESEERTIDSNATVPLFGVAVFGEAIFPGESPFVKRLARYDFTVLSGRIVHVEIEQTQDDPDFESYLIYLESTHTQDPYT